MLNFSIYKFMSMNKLWKFLAIISSDNFLSTFLSLLSLFTPKYVYFRSFYIISWVPRNIFWNFLFFILNHLYWTIFKFTGFSITSTLLLSLLSMLLNFSYIAFFSFIIPSVSFQSCFNSKLPYSYSHSKGVFFFISLSSVKIATLEFFFATANICIISKVVYMHCIFSCVFQFLWR